MSNLNLPHGGALTERLFPPDQAIAWRKQKKLKGLWPLTLRQLCDLEMIMRGAFSPLTGFLKKSDYDAVVTRMRLCAFRTERFGPFPSRWMSPITLLKNFRSVTRLVSRMRMAACWPHWKLKIFGGPICRKRQSRSIKRKMSATLA